jgi:uncharacterized phage-associated protein
VAKELVALSFAGDEADPLTNLRLQKLLYYAQAWSLVVRESELFSEDLEAWRHGPVVPKVYHALPDGQKASQITPDMFATAPDLPPEEAEFVARVWESYKQHSALQLSKMTHAESPWVKAWGDRPSDGTGNDPISVEEIEKHFFRETMPGPLAEYEHRLRKQEEVACRKLVDLPEINIAQFEARSNSYSPSASRAAGGV